MGSRHYTPWGRVREKFRIPRLWKFTKRVVRKCNRCKHFQVVAFANLPPAPLPRERTEGNMPFNVTSASKSKKPVVLYSCSLTCRVFWSYCPDWRLPS